MKAINQRDFSLAGKETKISEMNQISIMVS